MSYLYQLGKLPTVRFKGAGAYKGIKSWRFENLIREAARKQGSKKIKYR